MALYCGIDLHSTNCVIVLIDKTDRVQLEKRVPNQLDSILEPRCFPESAWHLSELCLRRLNSSRCELERADLRRR